MVVHANHRIINEGAATTICHVKLEINNGGAVLQKYMNANYTRIVHAILTCSSVRCFCYSRQQQLFGASTAVSGLSD